jgi:hypothetical protein
VCVCVCVCACVRMLVDVCVRVRACVWTRLVCVEARPSHIRRNGSNRRILRTQTPSHQSTLSMMARPPSHRPRPYTLPYTGRPDHAIVGCKNQTVKSIIIVNKPIDLHLHARHDNAPALAHRRAAVARRQSLGDEQHAGGPCEAVRG